MISSLTQFQGLRTALGNPPAESARALQNVSRHRHRGWLEQMDGYSLKFAGENDNGLPQTTVDDGANYLDPDIYLMSNLVWKDVHGFRVSDHGGKDITVAIATYRKSGFQTSPVNLDRCGVFVRPYWGFVDDPAASYPAGEEVDFELGDGGWSAAGNHSISRSGTDKYNGDYSLAIVASGAGSASANYVTLANMANRLTVGERYKIVFRARYSMSSDLLQFSIGGVSGTADVSPVAGVFTKCELEFTAASQTALKIWLPEAMTCYIDDVMLFGWVDAWQEITEAWQLEIVDTSGNHLYVNDLTDPMDPAFDFNTSSKPFNATYFRNWTIVYEGFSDDENYDRVRACGWESTGSYYYLDVDHPASDFATRVAGTKLTLYRHFMPQELPSDLESHILAVLTSLRITTGNESDDIALYAAFMTKQFTNTDANAADVDVDQLVAEPACLDIWQYAAVIAYVSATADGNGLPAGTYYLKSAVVLDDGQIALPQPGYTETLPASIYQLALNTGITFGSDSYIRIRPYISNGALPRRAKYLRIYLSDDNVTFYRVLDYDLTTTDDVPDVAQILGNYHCYRRAGVDTAITITDTEWTNKGAELTTDIGRSASASGIIRYKHAGMVGQKVFAGNVLIAGTAYPNNLIVSGENGDGDQQRDVFVPDSAHWVDVDYGDGDEIIGVAPQVERVLVLKRRSLVLVSPYVQGGYSRLLLTRGVGCCSAASIVSWDDVIYWADYHGLHSYSSMGLRLINPEWLEDWKALSDSQKQTATSVIDRANKQWIISAGSKQWYYDLIDGEWTSGVYTEEPVRFAVDPDTTVLAISDDTLILAAKASTATHDDGSVTCAWESNRIEPLKHQEGYALNVLLTAINVEYDSDVDLTLTVYLNESSSALTTQTLLATKKWSMVLMPFGARCLGFRVKIAATLTTATDEFKVKAIHSYYDKLPQGGDYLSQ